MKFSNSLFKIWLVLFCSVGGSYHGLKLIVCFRWKHGLKYPIYRISVRVETISVIDKRKKSEISMIYRQYIGSKPIYHRNIGSVA